MANPSRSGWFGMPPEKRFCSGCGRKVTLNQGALWMQEFPERRVFHWACRNKRVDA